MFHGAAFAALAALALAAGLGLGMAVVVFRDARAARRMDRSRP
jgi:hypothetical protein